MVRPLTVAEYPPLDTTEDTSGSLTNKLFDPDLAFDGAGGFRHFNKCSERVPLRGCYTSRNREALFVRGRVVNTICDCVPGCGE